jgi:hypothetical protein
VRLLTNVHRTEAQLSSQEHRAHALSLVWSAISRLLVCNMCHLADSNLHVPVLAAWRSHIVHIHPTMQKPVRCNLRGGYRQDRQPEFVIEPSVCQWRKQCLGLWKRLCWTVLGASVADLAETSLEAEI